MTTTPQPRNNPDYQAIARMMGFSDKWDEWYDPASLMAGEVIKELRNNPEALAKFLDGTGYQLNPFFTDAFKKLQQDLTVSECQVEALKHKNAELVSNFDKLGKEWARMNGWVSGGYHEQQLADKDKEILNLKLELAEQKAIGHVLSQEDKANIKGIEGMINEELAPLQRMRDRLLTALMIFVDMYGHAIDPSVCDTEIIIPAAEEQRRKERKENQ